MKRQPFVVALVAAAIASAVTLLAQNSVIGAITNLPGKVDSASALVVSLAESTQSYGSTGAIGNQPGKVDSNSALVVTCPDGSCDGYVAVEYPAAGDKTITSADSGKAFGISSSGGASPTVTLPDAYTYEGLVVTIYNWSRPSAGAGLLVDIPAGNFMWGNGFTGADGKGAVNSIASDRDGDAITLISDGAGGWIIISVTGTWAREA